jgi:CheY-like chemotaxis protein
MKKWPRLIFGPGLGIGFALEGYAKLGEAAGKPIMNPENKMTILVVDDDEVVGRVLSRVLTQQGHLVWRAQTGGEAVATAREHPPRLALLDLCLPDSDGIGLARQLRQEHPDLILILITAYPLRLREHPELNGVFTRVLIKPLDLADLRQAVESSSAEVINAVK